MSLSARQLEQKDLVEQGSAHHLDQTKPSYVESLRTTSASKESLDPFFEHKGPQNTYLLSHRQLLVEPTMSSSRKFSYASVKEEEDVQAFKSSLSTQEIEEIEWIASPCSHWCRSKGICSFHQGGTHEQYVESRLQGYARSNPKKLNLILTELDKRYEFHAQRRSSSASGRSVNAVTGLSPDTKNWILNHSEEVVFDDASSEEIVLDNEYFEVTPARPVRYGLEAMPNEILDSIFSHLMADMVSDPYMLPHVDLTNCTLVSKTLHEAVVRVMYRHVSIRQSRAFMKLNRSIKESEALGPLVHHLDFSHYSNMGYGRPKDVRAKTLNLTPTTLLECLERTTNLRSFLVHEHVDEELDTQVLSKLFTMPSMRALDLCACSSRPFTDAFTAICTQPSWIDRIWNQTGSFSDLRRLSLHECTTLREPVFEALLPRLTNVTHLDLAHTLVNDQALLSIPTTARITHLNLERCTRVTGSAVVKFVTTHTAIKNTAIYLNLLADASRYRLLDQQDLLQLLPALPATLRSLNLGGSRIDGVHVPHLRQLSESLEELGLRGSNLGLGSDLKEIFTRTVSNDGGADSISNPCTLRYIDLTDVKSISQMSLCYSPDSFINTSSSSSSDTTSGTKTIIDSSLIEVIELSNTVIEELKRRNKNVKNPEWAVRELGRRGWWVRLEKAKKNPSSTTAQIEDDGHRPWKMGAKWWGMRKIPMLEQDVGGMYGYFMFKKN